MRIELGRVACSGIEAHLGGDTEAAVNAALLHYTERLRSGREPIALPSFCCDRDNSEAPPAVLHLAVDPKCQALLKRDAARQGTSVARLAEHAVLVYLAELDSFASAASAPKSAAGHRASLEARLPVTSLAAGNGISDPSVQLGFLSRSLAV